MATNPDIIATNKWLILLSDVLSVNEQRELLLILGSASFCALVVSNLVIGFNLWLTMRFVVKTHHELSNRFLNYYLKQHYLYHIERNSAELIKNMMQENSRLLNGVVMNVLTLCSKYVTVIFIMIMLFVMDPVLLLFAIFTLGGSYLLIYVTIRRKLAKIGSHNSQLFRERQKLVSESLGGIKDLKLLGRTDYYLDRTLLSRMT